MKPLDSFVYTALPARVVFGAAMPQIAAAIAGTLEHSDAGLAIFELAQRLKAPASLRKLGLARDKFDALAREVVQRTTHNPRPVTIADLRKLLERAWRGDPQRPQHARWRDRRAAVRANLKKPNIRRRKR